MTAVAPRRAAIAEVLMQCPVGKWVDVDDFSRLMQATDNLFGVCWRWLGSVIRGYFNYHAIPGNMPRLSGFRDEVCRAWRATR